MRSDDEARATGRVLAIGEILWDLFEGEEELGGAPLNVARHLRRLGVECEIASAVGRDRLGDAAMEQLRRYGLAGGVRRDESLPTGTAEVHRVSGEENRYTIRRGVAWERIGGGESSGGGSSGEGGERGGGSSGEGGERDGEKPSAIIFGTLAMSSRENEKELDRLILALPRESLRVCDLNLRPPHFDNDLIFRSLERCNLLKINEEERELLRRLLRLDKERAEQELIERFQLRAVITTYGEEGIGWSDSDGVVLRQAAVPVKDLVSTVGAGDAVTALMTARMLQKRGSPADRLREAAELAAEVCRSQGAVPE